MEFAMRRLGITSEDVKGFYRKLDPYRRKMAIISLFFAFWDLFHAVTTADQVNSVCYLLNAIGELVSAFYFFQVAQSGYHCIRLCYAFGGWTFTSLISAVHAYYNGSHLVVPCI
jgi:hypothetical protein